MKTKRWMSFILAAALLALACLTLSACGASYNKIRYGKAYRVVYTKEIQVLQKYKSLFLLKELTI